MSIASHCINELILNLVLYKKDHPNEVMSLGVAIYMLARLQRKIEEAEGETDEQKITESNR